MSSFAPTTVPPALPVVPPRGPQRLAWQLLVEALLGALALVGLGLRTVLYWDARLRRVVRRTWRRRRGHARPRGLAA